ncbi:DUF1080 domain-containing protein [bacterium]|nr:DUF1080 domain-containing protein [bacterium]
MRTGMAIALALLIGVSSFAGEADKDGWVTIFDGKSLDGWKASEKTESFSVRDGMICVENGRSHLFYDGPVGGHDFKNVEWMLDVMTKAGANSGLYFHTKYQARGWPSGFECQVNNTHRDPKRTASLYNIVNVLKAPAKDDVWFNYHIIVKGKTVTVKIDGKAAMEYTQPDDAKKKLSHGTVAIQAHDPKSRIYYKNIKIKPLAD